MAITDQLLQQIVNAARIVPLGTTAPDVGVPLSFGLTPAFPTSLDTVQAGDISAVWCTKDVRFADALGVPAGTDLSKYLTNELTRVNPDTKEIETVTKVFGGQPVVDPGLTSPLPGGANPLLKLPAMTKIQSSPPTLPADDLAAGTPGVLGLFTGAVPIPIQVPVSVEVKWTVKKNSAEIQPGQEYLAPEGLAGPTLGLVFLASEVKKLEQPEKPEDPLFPKAVRFEISATVTATALGETASETTPSIPLDIPAILAIPTVLALFKHSDYAPNDGNAGWGLLAVPNNAALKRVNDLAPVLDTLRDTIKRLQSFKQETVSSLNLAAFLLGLGTLIDALNGQPKSQFFVGNPSDFKGIVFAESRWRIFPPSLGGSEHANDATSSVILIGVMGSGVKLFGDANFGVPDEHPFSLKLSVGTGGCVSIPTLDNVHAVNELIMVPPISAGTSAELEPERFEAEFGLGNKISSFEFI